jgi:aspartate aminotransferase
MIVSSYSKELSLAGERIGYLAVNPEAEDAGLVASAAAVMNTMLCVNAPSLPRRRDMLCQGLSEIGYEFHVPEGAFYLFPKSPIPDDVKFTQFLKEELILTVPGIGFDGPGYFRLSYAVPDSTITGSMEGFKRALEKV